MAESPAGTSLTPHLTTARLSLEPVSPGDAETMAGVLADPSLYAFTGGQPPSVEELRARYARWGQGPGRPDEEWHNWVVRLAEDVAVGHVQATLWSAHRTADVAWLIGTRWQGRGLASEAGLAVIRWLESVGVATTTAHIARGHLASEAVAKRLGMRPTEEFEDGERLWRRTGDMRAQAAAGLR